jgi:hypothetical protein
LPFNDLRSACLTVFHSVLPCSVRYLFLDLFHVSFYLGRFSPIKSASLTLLRFSRDWQCGIGVFQTVRAVLISSHHLGHVAPQSAGPVKLEMLTHQPCPEDSPRRASHPEKKNWIVWLVTSRPQTISGRACISLGLTLGFRQCSAGLCS